MSDIRIPKRVSTALINSLSAGVVPRIGLEYITVGRKREIKTFLNDLENVSEGGATFRFIAGRYGSGKSFLIQVIRNNALERNFVTADVDLSPERKLHSSNGQGQATYRELMQNISTKLRPDGVALESILQNWIQKLQLDIMKEFDITPDNPLLKTKVNIKIHELINSMESMNHGFDFSVAISSYWNGYNLKDDKIKQHALRWLRGEYPTKTEAKRDLNVSEIINDDNWYDYIKLFSKFVNMIGFKGFIIFIDEGVNLYKITNKISRENNYEKLLAMFNDTMQGKASNLAIFLGATPQLIEDNRRGLYSYEALRSRLQQNNFSNGQYTDMSAPVMSLETLSNEEIFVLLKKILDIHSKHYDYESTIQEEDLKRFMQLISNRIGADKLLTPREIIKDFIGVLNIIHQNKEVTFNSLLNEGKIVVNSAKSDPEMDNDDIFASFEL